MSKYLQSICCLAYHEMESILNQTFHVFLLGSLMKDGCIHDIANCNASHVCNASNHSQQDIQNLLGSKILINCKIEFEKNKVKVNFTSIKHNEIIAKSKFHINKM